jgi:hypothetical protein
MKALARSGSAALHDRGYKIGSYASSSQTMTSATLNSGAQQ